MESGEQKRTISGNVSMPEIYISEGEDIVLLFYSDAPVTGEGFSLRYRREYFVIRVLHYTMLFKKHRIFAHRKIL